MSTLQLSFHGPFLYRFLQAQVEIYAAKCPGHTAGLFTLKNEVPLTGRHRRGDSRSYRLTGPVFKETNSRPPVRFYDPDNTILDVPKTAKPIFENSHFRILVPVPKVVVATSANEVEIVDNSTTPPGIPQGVLKRQATGLRFYYDADLAQNLMLTLDGATAPAWMSDFDAASLGHDFADAEIRYASTALEAQEHQDAHDCFERVAGVAGVDWWLCYDDPTKPYGTQPFVKTGSDCKAPILVFR